MCRKLGVTRGGYYAWRKRSKSQRKLVYERLLERIQEVHNASKNTYGYPRVHLALKGEGIICGRNRIARLMRENSIVAKMARKFKRHTHKHVLFRDSSNLLLDKAPETAINQVWVGDITYIRVGAKWAYLSTVMDRYSREIIGWSFSRERTAALIREALLMAIEEKQPPAKTIFHSDQGAEYASKEYRQALEDNGFQVSMSRKGHCWDNAYMESFFHTLKTEMVYFMKFRHLAEAIAHIMEYMRFYNHERIHSGIAYLTPNQVANSFERQGVN